MYIPGAIEYNIYLTVQIFTVVCALAMLVIAAAHKPSKGQSVIMLFLCASTTYLFGFTVETLATTVEGYHLACIVEYFGETLVFIAFLHFVAFLCRRNIPIWIYIGQGIISVAIEYLVITARSNHIFYKEMYVITDGPFPHLGLTYNYGFYLTISYVAVLTVVLFGIIIRYMSTANALERKRCICTMLSVSCAWLPYVLKVLGLTGGYEIPGPGMVIAGFWLLLAMVKYGFMDSLVLAGERVIDNGSYAVLVLNTEYKVEYLNQQMVEIFGQIPINTNIIDIPEIRRIVAGNTDPIHMNDRIYEVKLDELIDNGFKQGYMILMFDNTEHYHDVEEIKELASRDSFTGLYNRTTFHKKFDILLSQECPGAFVMMDVDDFKLVNDRYGHAIGDEILLILAGILKKFNERDVLACRLGGDEFACFLLNSSDEEDVRAVLLAIVNEFRKGLEENGYTKYTSLSIGAVIVSEENYRIKTPDFDKLYSYADEVMYEVKHSGKGKFFIKSFPLSR